MTYYPNNPNGQATSANSAPVVIASNQSTLPIAGVGTAGVPGTAVLTVQGVASGTAQPVSGTVTATVAAATITGSTVAHDAVDSGNPLKVGGKAYTANPTAVVSADRSDFITDKLGKQVTVGSIRELKVQQTTTITTTTETTILTAGAAGVFHDVYGLILTNTSATATVVSIKDATAGTTRLTFSVPAGDTRGFMLNESAAHNQATAANNWTATLGTAVTSLIVTTLAVKNL